MLFTDFISRSYGGFDETKTDGCKIPETSYAALFRRWHYMQRWYQQMVSLMVVKIDTMYIFSTLYIWLWTDSKNRLW